MRKVSLALAVLLALAGCASGRGGDVPAGLIPPEISLAQYGDYSFSLQYAGPTTIVFELSVRNPSSEPITLRQIRLQSVGSGAYTLRRDPQFLNRDIEPGETFAARLAVPAYAQGGRTGSREPVTIRGIAYFESEHGPFQRVFFANFTSVGGE